MKVLRVVTSTPRPGKHRTKQTPRTFTVEMTEGEVDFLLAVLSRVGGDPRRSPRKYQERISAALADAAGYAFDSPQDDAGKLVQPTAGVYFSNYPSKPPRRSRLQGGLLCRCCLPKPGTLSSESPG